MFEAGRPQLTGSVLWLRRGVRKVHTEIMDVAIPLHPLKERPFAVFSLAPILIYMELLSWIQVLTFFKCKYLSDAVSVSMAM